MRRRTLMRDLLGTAVVFLLLIGFTTLIILVEHFLENFKSH